MQKIGIICEYNPFHNGHIYHINKIKELYPNSLIILILNGYFLERGEISLLSKEDKTRISLENNVDIVLELPAIFGTQSADIFAYHSIEILNHFQINRIIFGSESNDMKNLEKIADIQLSSSTYQDNVKEYLKKGINYPTALAKALNIDFEFNNPNDLLAISYIKAIKQINNKISFESIKRTSSYHDTASNNTIISASNIRKKIKDNQDIHLYLPKESYSNLVQVDEDLFYTLLKYKINTDENLEKYLDVGEGIENRLKKYINECNTLNDFIQKIKTKRYTYNKINRMLIHILISFNKSDNINNVDYIKILGFNTKGQKYINSIKKELNVLIKNNYNSNTYKLEQNAALLYQLLTNHDVITFEKKNKPIIKKVL